MSEAELPQGMNDPAVREILESFEIFQLQAEVWFEQECDTLASADYAPVRAHLLEVAGGCPANPSVVEERYDENNMDFWIGEMREALAASLVCEDWVPREIYASTVQTDWSDHLRFLSGDLRWVLGGEAEVDEISLFGDEEPGFDVDPPATPPTRKEIDALHREVKEEIAAREKAGGGSGSRD